MKVFAATLRDPLSASVNRWGAAHGALAMTTPGDNAVTSLVEVESLVTGRGAAAVR